MKMPEGLTVEHMTVKFRGCSAKREKFGNDLIEMAFNARSPDEIT